MWQDTKRSGSGKEVDRSKRVRQQVLVLSC